MIAPTPKRPWGGLLESNTGNYPYHMALWDIMLARSTIPVRISYSNRNTKQPFQTQDFNNSLELVTAVLHEWSGHSSAHAITFKDMFKRWLEAADPGLDTLFARAEKFIEFLQVDVTIEPILAEPMDQPSDQINVPAAAPERYTTDPVTVRFTDPDEFQARWTFKAQQTSGMPYMSHHQDTKTGERTCTWYYPSAFHLVLDALHTWVPNPQVHEKILYSYLAHDDPHPQAALNRIVLDNAVLVAQAGDMWSFPLDPRLVSQT